MRTFIRWPGNKSQHINKFIHYIPEYTGRYIEPFLGSGALFLRLQPKNWIINDLNQDLINVWTCVKYDPNKIINYCKRFEKRFVPMSKEDKLQYCRKLTSKIEILPFELKRCYYYLLMKHCCFMNNIMIKNKFYFQGLDLHIQKRNKYYFLEQPYYDNIRETSQFLNSSNGQIYNESYEHVLNKSKKGDFVFLDPPYIEPHEYGFNYNSNEVLDDDFVTKLCLEVQKLDKKGIKWLMTQADTKHIRNIFKDYKIKTFTVYRMASKTYINELLIMNY
jgi:DNA adenine methylase